MTWPFRLLLPALLVFATLGTVFAPAVSAQPVPVASVYVYGSGTDRFDRFGTSTAVLDGGRTVLVGASNDLYQNSQGNGRVYVFEQAAPGGPWTETGLWLPPFDQFNRGGGAFAAALAVSPDDSLVVVGAPGTPRYATPQHPIDIEAVGAAHIFRRTGASGTTAGWTHEARLRDPAAQEWTYGGSSVAVAGRLAAMNIDGHRARLFRDLGPAGPGGEAGPWAAEATFALPAGGPHLRATGTLALADDASEGERLVAGAFYAGAGRVHVWRNDGPAGGPAAWVQEAVLSRPVPGGAFGSSVALSPDGRLLAVGADEFTAGPNTGRAYVFRREGAGAASTWAEEALLLPSRPATFGFGGSVALSTDPVTGDPLLLVAAPGEVYVYRRSVAGGGPSWSEAAFAADTFYAETPRLSGHTAAAGYEDAGELGIGAGRAIVFDLRAALAVAGEDAPPAHGEPSVSVSPNPTRGAAAVSVTLAAAGPAEVVVVDALGRVVAVVHRGALAAGRHRWPVDASRWPAGVYAVRAASGGTVAAARVVVVR